MSRIAPPAEKVLATVGVFKALMTELHPHGLLFLDPAVQAAVIDAAVYIAMGTDTRDMGIMSPTPATRDLTAPEFD